MGGAELLQLRLTIDALPDNVLLEILELDLGKEDGDRFDHDHDYSRWQMLVQVCRRWRYIVFASPRRLDLAIKLRTSTKSKALDIWPSLPIVIRVFAIQSKEQVTNVIAAFRERSRVRKIYYNDADDCDIQDSLWKVIAAIDEPFPALTGLVLVSSSQNVPVFPDSFLGGSAPRLRSLYLDGIPYPSIGKLLSSTTNLVRLSLWGIPHSGYISPETIVPLLSMLPVLKLLVLGFQYDQSRARRASRHSPLLTRVVFPNINITYLHFRGEIEYTEDILSQIETPILSRGYFCFFNQLVFDTPRLGHFIRRTEIFMTIHTARVNFNSWDVEVILLGQDEMDNHDAEPLELHISCKPLDWQLSAVAQVLNSLLSSLLTLESLEIAVHRDDWQGEIEVTQWLEFFHPLISVKEMTLVCEDSVRLLAPALQELNRERPMEVLPTLQALFIPMCVWQSSGPLKEAIEQFIAIRQLYGHPVTVTLDYRDTESEDTEGEED